MDRKLVHLGTHYAVHLIERKMSVGIGSQPDIAKRFAFYENVFNPSSYSFWCYGASAPSAA